VPIKVLSKRQAGGYTWLHYKTVRPGVAVFIYSRVILDREVCDHGLSISLFDI
jgi:hypothetical protein